MRGERKGDGVKEREAEKGKEEDSDRERERLKRNETGNNRQKLPERRK